MELLVNGLILFIILVGIALVSMAEAAFFGMPMEKIKSQAQLGDDNCIILLELREHLVSTIAALLITHAVLGVFGGMVSAKFQIGQIHTGILVGGYTLILLIFGEIFPKAYGLTHADTIAPRFSRGIKALRMMLLPFAQLCELFSFMRSKSSDHSKGMKP